MLKSVQIQEINFGTPQYKLELELRERIFKKPFGLTFSSDELSNESDFYHFGCFIQDELLACLVLKPLSRMQMQMKQVAVIFECQGKGIGGALVKHSENFAREHGYAEMFLRARETALPFYERLDYQKIGDQLTDPIIPHWELLKKLY